MELPEAITGFIDNLTAIEQDRLLVGRFVAHQIGNGRGFGCLLGLAYSAAKYDGLPRGTGIAGSTFDNLCGWGGERTGEVGAAIRDYICELRARTLRDAPQLQTVA